jgi:hypothetical protein
LSRTSLAPLLVFSSILFSFSLYSRSEGPPIVCTSLAFSLVLIFNKIFELAISVYWLLGIGVVVG